MKIEFPAATMVEVDTEEVRAAIRAEYREVATSPDKGFHFHTGRTLANILGYREEWLAGIPEASIESFAGTGSPFAMGELKPGERVVDVGSGAGIDSLIAAKMVGAEGEVVGVDMTAEMLAKARAAAAETGMEHVRFVDGYMEELPVDDGWADVIISNGVFNLSPNKPQVLREMFRALRPGGRLQLADIMVEKEVSATAKQKIDLWTGWIAGALLEAELEAAVAAAGFEGFEITWKKTVFDGAPQESSAWKFGTHGINFCAYKPER